MDVRIAAKKIEMLAAKKICLFEPGEKYAIKIYAA
jgi:hypothetical protein